MSRTDKDIPYRIKLIRGEQDHANYRERGSGPKGVRAAKKEARRARRRGITHPWMVKSLRTTYKYNSG